MHSNIYGHFFYRYTWCGLSYQRFPKPIWTLLLWWLSKQLFENLQNCPRKCYYCKYIHLDFKWIYLSVYQIFSLCFPHKITGTIWYFCTVTFDEKSSKLNSRPVYCSRLYRTLTSHKNEWINSEKWGVVLNFAKLFDELITNF